MAKRRYARTNKNNFVLQLAKHEARERFLIKIYQGMQGRKKSRRDLQREHERLAKKSRLPHVDPLARYHMSVSSRDHSHLDIWLEQIQAKFGIKV
jgi:hypothetical protein